MSSTTPRRLDHKLRKAVLERDGHRCQRCERRTDALAIHHIHRHAEGGPDSLQNLLTLCSPCHREWHMAHETTSLSFAQWMKLPPLPDLLILAEMPWPDDLSIFKSGEELKRGLIDYLRMTRLAAQA